MGWPEYQKFADVVRVVNRRSNGYTGKMENNPTATRGKLFGLWSVLVTCLFLLLSTSRVEAATVSWDGGGGDGNWTTGANWSNDLIPGADDDVTVDANVTVNLTGAATVNSLSLGNEGGTSAAILHFGYDAVGIGALVIDEGDAVIHSGATMRHSGASGGSMVGRLSLEVGGNLTVNGTISGAARGYAGGAVLGAGFGPGGGLAGGSAGGGASFASTGGAGSGVNNSRNVFYDSAADPDELGSGGGGGNCGGSGVGGAGGGAVKVVVTGTIDIDGSVSVAGGNG